MLPLPREAVRADHPRPGGRAAAPLTCPRGVPSSLRSLALAPKCPVFFPPMQLGFSILYLTGFVPFLLV